MERERELLGRWAGVAPGEICVAVSPYRICPIGAHIDHQSGPVLGMAISAWSVLAFASTDAPRVRLFSEDFESETSFDLSAPAQAGDGWGRYPRGAAWALRERLPRRPRGLVGRVVGSLAGGGLSSSASVLVATLLALARANAVDPAPEELVELARRAENDFVGVASGILDPASVVGSRRGKLLLIDTREARWQPVPPGPSSAEHRFLVVYAGRSRNLARTPFNQRVAECRAAAARLAALGGISGAQLLGDLPDAVFGEHLGALPAAEQGRARHFRGERARVLAGVDAWRRGDLEAFGKLMSESCRSSVENYETGSREQIELQRILLETPRVLGARFSGAGFGGCSVALVQAEGAEETRERVKREYLRAFPELAGRVRAFLVESEDGARLL